MGCKKGGNVKLICLLVLSLSISAIAAPDYSLLSGILGVRSVLKWNGNYREGTVEIVASDAGVGFKTVPLMMGTSSVPEYSLITDSTITSLTRTDNTITQVAKVGANDIKITYQILDGYYIIQAQDCTTAACRAIEVVATTGKAPGDVVDATKFLPSLEGTYQLVSAGGAPPKENDDKAEVDSISDPTETAFYFPYCTPAGCDLGYVGFQYTGVTITHENLGVGRDIYTLLKYNAAKVLLHYDWEVNGTDLTFRNHQYALTGGKVALEHVFHKMKASDE